MKRILLINLAFYLVINAFAQQLSNNDYKKALWMTARMYGGQRSGEGPNWLIMDHTPSNADMQLLTQAKNADVSKLQAGKCFTGDADGDYSLSGGWVDCGDHVKFGQTMFYAAYTLLKGYAEFPEGYDDYYSFDYNGYQSAADFSWEGGKGAPNGIPDILDELKYQCDFLIKCARSGTQFYSQVGDGDVDHMNWVTSVAMATLPKNQGGQADGPRFIVKNPDDASMPYICASTLALMSVEYRKFDPVYADLCLEHAKYAYTYAESKQWSTAAAPGGYYPANKHAKDDCISASAELFWATGEESYKTTALSLSGDLKSHNWCYNYNNNDDVALYNLAKLGDANGKALLEEFVAMYKGKVGSDGLFTGGDEWGTLRYNANSAFVIALWGRLTGATEVDQFIYDNIDFILGGNSDNFSFVVGFERENCPSCHAAVHPHHRNVFLSDDIMADQATMQIPEHNKQHGYMIGGARKVPFTESTVSYTTSEGGIDYNAGLVGALGYINSMLAPIDINKFGHPAPVLDEEISICGTGSATLSATIDLSNLEAGESVTFEWYKTGNTSPFESGDAKLSVTVTEPGEYTCMAVEKSGAWTTQASVNVTDVLPVIDLGADFVLCTPAYRQLDAEIAGEGLSYVWNKDGAEVATGPLYTIYEAGTYSVVLSASGCESTESSVTVTSLLPDAINDVICAAGQALIGVDAAEGIYEWYETEDGSSSVNTGFTYNPTVAENTTFYVKDVSSFKVPVGPSAEEHTLAAGSNGGAIGIVFEAKKAFTIESLTVAPFVYGCNSGDKVSVDFELQDQSGTAIASYSTVGVSCEGSSDATTLAYYELAFETPVEISEAGIYRLMPTGGNQLIFFESGADYTQYDYADVIDIISDTRSDKANSFPGIFDIIVSTGKDCALQPVFVTIDPNLPDCGSSEKTATIALKSGWNLISLPLQVADMSVTSIFAGKTQVEVIKDFNSFYDFTQESFLSTLTTLEMGEAYLVKCSAATTVSITGTEVSSASVSLGTGWNLIGYPHSGTADIETVLSDILDSVESLKTFDATYINGGGQINSLTDFTETEGYFIKMAAPKNLSF